jgi:hypothetical protein
MKVVTAWTDIPHFETEEEKLHLMEARLRMAG